MTTRTKKQAAPRSKARVEGPLLDVREVKLLKADDPLPAGCEAVCKQCGGTDFVDVPIHSGRSLRRDCTFCHGRFMGFSRWDPRGERQ